MEITLPISSLIIIAIGSIGVAISLLTGVLFYLKQKKHHISNVFLCLLLLLIGLTLLNEILTSSGISNRFKNLYFIPIHYSLSIAPLFYLFVKSKYYNRHLNRDYLHLLIPAVQAIIYWSIGFRDVAYKSDLWATALFRNYSMLESFLFPISLIFYSVLSLMLLKKPSDERYFWNADLRSWLTNFTKFFIWIAALEIFVSTAEYFYGHHFTSSFYILRLLVFVALILWIAYNTLKLSYPSLIYNTRPKVHQALLTKVEIKQTKNAILELMENEKVYLNPDLSLQLLAEYVGTTEKKCSYALSKGFATNFNQFINTYRVETFKTRVQAGKHKEFTLLSLAYDCGFASKPTFNRSFKLLNNGITPSQYVKSLKNPT